MYGVSAPLAVIMGIGMWWLPSSPRWILLCAIQGKGELQGLREKAICCVCQLRGAAIGDSASRQVDDILSELSQLSEEKQKCKATQKRLTSFTRRNLQKG